MASFAKSPDTHGAGQNHDIIHDHVAPGALDPPGDPVEITAWQKMLSATSGSLLTGLLATPLDVVRVRWQSQNVTRPHPTDFTKLALPTTTPRGAAFSQADLGVTACCREVFFTTNTSEVCVVGTRPLGGSGGGSNLATAAAAPINCAVEQTQQRTFTSTFDGLRKIARNEGVTTLWRGLSPTLIMAIPANIIYFTGYEWLRFNHASPIARTVNDDCAALVAGSAARVLAAIAVSPIELFRTRLQALQGASSSGGTHLASTFRGVKDMVAVHGYRSLWRGLTLTLWRDVPFSGMYWWGYETIRGHLADARERARARARARTGRLDLERDAGGGGGSGSDWGGEGERGRAETGPEARACHRGWRSRAAAAENHTETFTDSFIAGAASGGFASIVTMPFDVGKTRTQVFRNGGPPGSSSAAAAAPEECNMARLLWHIFRTEGLPGLFRGCVPRTLRVAPACAIMISSYEVGKRVFRGVNERALAERRALAAPAAARSES